MVEEDPSISADDAKCQFLLPPASKKVPEESSCRFRGSLLHNAENSGEYSSHVPVQEKRAHESQVQDYARPVSFSQPYVDSMSFDSLFYVGLFFLINVPFSLRICKQSKQPYLREGKSMRDSTT